MELEARIIDDLLDLTRITHGKLALRFEPVDVPALIEHALTILRSDREAKNISVECDLDAAPRRASGDGVRLQQVFWNVLKNAIKFTPIGGRITIRSWNEGGHLRVSVTDTGLPDGSGHDVVAVWRGKSRAPAVAMSGHGMEADLARTQAAGFAEHLVKPVSAEGLRELLTRFPST